MKPKTRRRRYLREAGITLLLARLAVRMLPSFWVLTWARRKPRHARRFAAGEVGWVSWAIETAGAAPSVNAPSLPRALATLAMLRRRGIASELVLGVAYERGVPAPHAWVEVGGDKIVGGVPGAELRSIAAFGEGRG